MIYAKRRRGEEEKELCALLEELDERAEKRFEEREERMRKFEMEMEGKRADREEKMEENMMRMLAGLFQAYPPWILPRPLYALPISVVKHTIYSFTYRT